MKKELEYNIVSEVWRIDTEDCDCENGTEMLDIHIENLLEEPMNMDEWVYYELGYDIGYGYYATYDEIEKKLILSIKGPCL
jgi:hypothetical protein